MKTEMHDSNRKGNLPPMSDSLGKLPFQPVAVPSRRNVSLCGYRNSAPWQVVNYFEKKLPFKHYSPTLHVCHMMCRVLYKYGLRKEKKNPGPFFN